MSRSDDLIADLRQRIVRIIGEKTGLHERLALPIAEEIVAEMQREFGGTELYVPARSAKERYSAIRDALDVGMSPAKVERQFNVSRMTIYRAIQDGKVSTRR